MEENSANSITCEVNWDLLGFLLQTVGNIGKYDYVPFITNAGLDMSTVKPMADQDIVKKIHEMAINGKQGVSGIMRTGEVNLSLREIEVLKDLMESAIELGTRIINESKEKNTTAWKNVVEASKRQLDSL